MGLAGTIKSRFLLKTRLKLPSPVPGELLHRVLPFGLCNAPAKFQRAVIGIFSELVSDSMDIFMDDFNPYGKEFEEALKILEKVLTCCEQTQLSLSTKKCHMMMSEGVVLGNFIFVDGI